MQMLHWIQLVTWIAWSDRKSLGLKVTSYVVTLLTIEKCCLQNLSKFSQVKSINFTWRLHRFFLFIFLPFLDLLNFQLVTWICFVVWQKMLGLKVSLYIATLLTVEKFCLWNFATFSWVKSSHINRNLRNWLKISPCWFHIRLCWSSKYAALIIRKMLGLKVTSCITTLWQHLYCLYTHKIIWFCWSLCEIIVFLLSSGQKMVDMHSHCPVFLQLELTLQV